MTEMSRNTLYDPLCLAGFRRKQRIGLAAAAVTAAAGIGISLWFCFAFRPFGAIAVSTVAGWICIFLLELVILPAKNRARHYQTVLDGEQHTYTGTISLGKEPYQLRRGVNYYPVSLRDGENTVSLFLYAPLRKKVCQTDRSVRVTAAHGFLLSVEVLL